MIYATAAQAAAATRFSRVAPEGGLLWRTDYFGPPPSPKGSNSVDPRAMGALEYLPPGPDEVRPPQAFLVEQEMNAVVHPHFHFVDQFQVVVEGGGAIGRHAVQPIMAHFAGANTAYGPITPGEAGLKYFTLRASADGTGAQFLPAAKARMARGPKRYVLADPVLPSTPAALAGRREALTEMVLAEPDGLAILMLRIPPHGQATAPDPSRGAGQSMLVAAGAIRHQGEMLGRLSALFIPRDEAPFLAEAGPEGAEILVLQYPRPERE
ncbi:hypothetical protein [Sediminicoccus sp. KRV36]|uniref:hypothetical protein n=1 Tax=Sediminicoccus sp. KRV36 TaxID=3133721 RepID=UPI00200DCED1|nr:hypothetical protein [Sediminicoccus rosea]UPY35959.1 hypothetical protein LHU95_17300 [Sediminicoccus rosea]